MFGLIKKRSLWSFAVFGKHPATGDFIRLGSETPIVTGTSSCFIGGRGNKNRMIVFKRSLKADDFNQLWSEADVEI